MPVPALCQQGGRALGETTCAQLTCCVTCAAPLLPLLPLAERPRLEVLPWDGVRRRDEVLRLEPEPERGLELLLSRSALRRFGDRDLREAERSPRGLGDEEPALRACCGFRRLTGGRNLLGQVLAAVG